MLNLVLFQPDIPQNAGTLLRLCACMGLDASIIEPAGFPISDKHFRRAGLDYLKQITVRRYNSFNEFQHWREAQAPKPRLILLSTHASQFYTEINYLPGDLLLLGRESAGVPPEVVAAADIAVHIPMRPGFRSLNVAIAGAMVAGEALRQLRHTKSDKDM